MAPCATSNKTRNQRTQQEKEMRDLIKRFVVEEDGMEMVEWALVASVFALGGILAWETLANTLSDALNAIGNRVAGAGS
jgi:Flp pilus assembly pilin Flp